MADKQDSCGGCQRAHAPGDLDPVQIWQADIQQNQIRLQLFGFLDGFQAIRSLSDPELNSLAENRTDESPDGRKVIDYKDFTGLHSPSFPVQMQMSFRVSGVVFLKLLQFRFRNDKLSDAAIQANEKRGEYPDDGPIETFWSTRMDSDLTSKAAETLGTA